MKHSNVRTYPIHPSRSHHVDQNWCFQLRHAQRRNDKTLERAPELSLTLLTLRLHPVLQTRLLKIGVWGLSHLRLFLVHRSSRLDLLSHSLLKLKEGGPRLRA